MRILGIDPGLRVTGYGVIDHESLRPVLLDGGIIRLKPATSIADRLVELEIELETLFDEHKPDVCAIEQLYAHYAHPRTAILMGHARGVILLVARRRGAIVEHYSANRIKQSLVGHGHATKLQMQRAIQSLWNLKSLPQPPDVADALAVALCCARAHERGKVATREAMAANSISIVASALGTDPRQIPRAARQMGFTGLVLDAFWPLLDVSTLSQSGRREFVHMLSSENQRLVGLQMDLGPRGLGPGADVDQQIARLDRAMESAAGLQAPLVLVDVGPLPQPASTPVAPPTPSAQQLGPLFLPVTTAAKSVRIAPPPDPKFVAQLNAAMSEIALCAERYSVTVGFSSSLASFAAIASALADVRCHWFGVDLDTSALLRDDWSFDEVFSALGPQFRHVRARDAIAGADKRTKPAILGQGTLDWRQVLALLDEAAYAGWLTIDPTDLTDRRAGAIAGLKHLSNAIR